MARWMFALVLAPVLVLPAFTQQDSAPDQDSKPKPSARDREAGESSSKSTRIDLSPPKNDDKDHPTSGAAISDADPDNETGVQEFRSWDPHRAAKDVEVGDYYFRRKNYRAALARYTEALEWKPDDAIANFRIGECQDKLHNPDEARSHYQAYLKILPHGPLAQDAQKALAKLKPSDQAKTNNSQ